MAHAGGKVILVGEHAVVYGVEAIAAGLERGVDAVARPASSSALLIDGRTLAAGDLTELAFSTLLDQLQAAPCRVEVRLDMPAGVGLGASAAIGVAVARAVSELAGRPLDPASLLQAVNAWEGVFHGNPSGIDAACSALGSCIRYSKSAGPRPLHLARSIELAIALAGPASSTKDMVARVALLRAANPARFEGELRAIAELAEQARHCLERGLLQPLGAVLDANHAHLVDWQLSTPDIERACQLARSAGALGAKVTGAGGGGCVIALCPDSGPERILHAWRDSKFTCFATRVRAQDDTE